MGRAYIYCINNQKDGNQIDIFFSFKQQQVD
jgi:hypothetical protein